MAKPSRWPAIKDPAADPRDNFDSSLPLGDIPVKKADTGNHYKPAVKPIFCEYCGGRDFWQLEGGRYVCNTCRPQPQPSRASMIKCLNELDDRGQPIPFVCSESDYKTAQPVKQTEAPTWDETSAKWERYQSRVNRAHDLYKRDLIPYSKVNEVVKLAAFELNGTAGSWAAVDHFIDELENLPTAQTVSFYAEMGVDAARRFSKNGGGWRLYVLAKKLDAKGLGMVKRDELEAFALALGVNVRTFQRWMKQARNNDLFIDMQSQSGEWLLRLPSAGRAAAALDIERLSRKVTMRAVDLIGKGWKARVWGAYEATFNGMPISREKMQKVINVPVSTQRYRDASAKVDRTPNYCKSAFTAGMLTGLKDYSKHKGIFLSKNGFIYWRLPNSYQVDFAQRGGRGRAKKANKIIKSMQSINGLFQKQQALSFEVETKDNFVRLFNSTPAATKATMKKFTKIDESKPASMQARPAVNEIYEQAGHAKQNPRTRTRSIIWAHCPV